MDQLFLPVLSHFENGNPWSASAGRMRFLAKPAPAEATLIVEVWEGPWAYEFSVAEEVKTFPLTQEGLDALPAWLESWRQTIDARPSRTLAADIARRDAALAAKEGTV